MCDNGVWLEAHYVNRGAREPMCRNRSQDNILRLQSVLSYLSGIKNTTIRKTFTGRRRRRRRRRARNHGDGWVPKGRNSGWMHTCGRQTPMCTNNHRALFHFNSYRSRRKGGTMTEDGFPQELQWTSGSQDRQEALDQCRRRRRSRNQGKDGF